MYRTLVRTLMCRWLTTTIKEMAIQYSVFILMMRWSVKAPIG